MNILIWLAPLVLGTIVSLLFGDLWGIALGVPVSILLLVIVSWFVYIPANTLGVRTNSISGAVIGLLAPGPHLVLRPVQALEAVLSTLSTRLDGAVPMVHSADGLPVEAHWTVLYHLAPEFLRGGRDQLSAIMPFLIQNPNAPVRLHMDDILRSVLGQYPVQWLSEANHRSLLTRQTRHMLHTRMGAIGIRIERVILGPFLLPDEFQERLIQTQVRQMEAQTDSLALNVLQTSAHNWGPEDRNFVTDLEQLRVMRENGVLLYPGGYSGWPPGSPLEPPAGSAPRYPPRPT